MFSKKRSAADKQRKMSAPPEISLRNMNGTQWSFKPALSGDYARVLALQQVNFLLRSVLARTSFALSVKQWDDAAGTTRLELTNTLSAGLPGTTDRLHLDWQPDELRDAIFGRVRDRARWLALADIEDAYQREGWEAGTAELMEIFTDHLDAVATTSQVCGFEWIDDVRYYVRRLLVRRGEEAARIRLVFAYVGTVGGGSEAAAQAVGGKEGV